MNSIGAATQYTISKTDHGSSSTSASITDGDSVDISLSPVEDTGNGSSASSSVDDDNHKQTVVLIVANSRRDTVGLVESLKSSITTKGEWNCQEQAAGVHVYDCKSRFIVDTLPLMHIKRGTISSSAIARRWISQNGLRRIVFGKELVVVCVVHWRLVNSRRRLWWMEVFGLIFSCLSTAVVMIVKTENQIDSMGQQRIVEVFLEKHGLSGNKIILSNYQSWHNSSGTIKDLIFPSKTATVVPFPMSCKFQKDQEFIWRSERVILLGKSGTGKSTLAQMLTFGRLDPENKTFVTKKGLKGETENIQCGDGRGWYVVDTPGFGESKQNGTIETQKAVEKIRQYVKLVEGTFAHYLFVVKMDRLDELDQRMWAFLRQLFGDVVNHNFSIVISGADDIWVEKNRQYFNENFKGCVHLFGADFSRNDSKHPALNGAYEDIRKRSLEELENYLARRKLSDRHFRYGRRSRVYLDIVRQKAKIDGRLGSSRTGQFLNTATQCFHSVDELSSRSLAKLIELLKIDDRRILSPEI